MTAADADRLKNVSGDVPQIVLMVLGAGPSAAMLQSLLAANQANGIMYHAAVSQQQMTNILGMVTTAKAVHYLLEPHTLEGDGDMPRPSV